MKKADSTSLASLATTLVWSAPKDSMANFSITLSIVDFFERATRRRPAREIASDEERTTRKKELVKLESS